MPGWDALLYLKFEDERTRPARDLLAQVPLPEATHIYDLGCGPGNSTELIAARFPRAEIVGIDSSAEMLAKARHSLPSLSFQEADLSTWMPDRPTDLLFANAVFQWVPGHLAVLRRLIEALPPGGVLAVQMPDNLDEPSHVAMRVTAMDMPFAAKLEAAVASRDPLPSPGDYYDALQPLSRHIDLWHTVYEHALDNAASIVEWVMGTGLRPFLAPLDAAEQKSFLDAYTSKIAEAYPTRIDGRVLLRFPRFFLVAVRA
jgi:trans-aconitate 2-methyltransferase